MKAQPLQAVKGGYFVCDAAEATHVRLHFPGPIPNRIIPVVLHGPRSGTPCWTWNGNVEHPTLRPSILSECPPHRCHTFVADGRVQFLSDCSHELAGQTVDLLEVET